MSFQAEQSTLPLTAWSDYQRAVFDFIATGTGHGVVLARAGSGKTSTILECLRRVDPRARALLCAFGQEIAKELKTRAPGGTHVRTLHSLGFAAVRAQWGNVQMSEDRARELVEQTLAVVPDALARDELYSPVAKLVGLAKASLALTPDAVLDLAYEHQLVPVWAELGQRDDGTPLYGDADLAAWTLAAMRAACKPHPVISFDDMVFIPAVFKWRTGTYDIVFVDETQDMSAAQLRLALHAIGPKGRIICVGDEHQAIFKFRGADDQAIPRIIRELSATVLPLSISYRCPRKVADLARRYVPDLETPAGAADGTVGTVSRRQAEDAWRPGDWVISRTNAPLVGACLACIRAGKPAKIRGRGDVASGLAALIKKSKTTQVANLLEWIDQWERDETAKLVAAKKESKAELVRDKAETVRALADGATTCNEILKRLDQLFSDDRNSKIITFSSTHRAKGLESDRVFLFLDTYRPGMDQEERNLMYVAITRSKRELYLIKDHLTDADVAPVTLSDAQEDFAVAQN